MKVAQLQSYLDNLAGPVEASGGKTVANDLRRVAQGLAPFAELTVAQFSDFLAAADEYARTGVVPTAGGRARKAQGPAVDHNKVTAAAQELLTLYEQALDADLTYAQISASVKKIGGRLNKDETIAAAKEVGITHTLKTKKHALEELERKIVERKESLERATF